MIEIKYKDITSDFINSVNNLIKKDVHITTAIKIINIVNEINRLINEKVDLENKLKSSEISKEDFNSKFDINNKIEMDKILYNEIQDIYISASDLLILRKNILDI